MLQALPACLRELSEGLGKPRRSRDHAIGPGRRLGIAGPVQRCEDLLNETPAFLQHRLDSLFGGILAAGQGTHLLEAGEFLDGEHHVVDRGLISHGVTPMVR